MSKNLARLLAKDENELTKSITKLEEFCGFPSEDVRMLAENKQKVRTKIQQLGLDANDTTDQELYHALRARFEKDSHMLDKALGVDGNTKFEERINKAIQLVNHCASIDEVWVVRNSVAKSALVKFPPKHVAKMLRYRSVASMIKRQDVAELYLLASVLESLTWQNNVAKHLSRLSVSQYELRPIKIVNITGKPWTKTSSPSSQVVLNKQLGILAIWHTEELTEVSVLCLTLLLLEGLRSLNPGGYKEAIHELSPSLSWWADTEQIISDGDQPVSLNIKDVSFNHLQGHEITEAVRHHGAHSLWSELNNRYRSISASLSDKVPDIQYNFSGDQPVRLPTSADLAEEYVTVE